MSKRQTFFNIPRDKYINLNFFNIELLMVAIHVFQIDLFNFFTMLI